MPRFIPVEMQTMNVTFWYGAILALGVALWISYRFTRWFLGSAAWLLKSFLLRHLVYPNTVGWSARLGGLTRLELLLVSIYVVTNALCMGLGVKSIAEATRRSGVLSVINLLPLFAGSWLGLVADLLGVSLRTQLLVHRCIGALATVQGILHSAVAIFGPLQGPWDDFRTFGTMVSPGQPAVPRVN
jgi:hypothetical protein